LTASALLGAWERGLAQSPVNRALGLLAIAAPDEPRDALAKLSIGRRDRRLLELREAIFGSQMSGLATCAGCGRQVELRFASENLRSPADASVDDSQELAFSTEGYEFMARLPNSDDVAAISDAASVEQARRVLLMRCISGVRRRGDIVEVERLPASVASAVAEQLAKADPLADVHLAVTCPDCGRAWRESFDIVPFLWTEIHAWAVRLLREVHCLAAAYGWREVDILAMSPWRRQAYLEMVAAG
jgi:hypothetical protein